MIITNHRYLIPMDTFDCIATKLESKEFSRKEVPNELKRKILEAARLSPSGMNAQHWGFVLVDTPEELAKLAEDSITGSWVKEANFAIIVLTDPKYPFHLLDAGRVIQNMQLAAWNEGVTSRIYTGVKEEEMIKDFGIPRNLHISAVVGFGYPIRKVRGRKNRKPLEALAFYQRYGERLTL